MKIITPENDPEKSEREKVMTRALYIMGAGDNTPRMLYEKLCEKLPGTDKEIIKSEIRKLMASGTVDEKRYGDRLIEVCKRKLYGHRRIETELEKRKFSKKYILNSSDDIVSDEDERAEKLFRKKMDSMPDYGNEEEVSKFMRRTFAYMQRMGYDVSSIKSAMKEYNDNI